MKRTLPPLNGLRAFEAAARHMSFTDAADELSVTQAAISHQVRGLEQRLGLKLFVRKNRSLLLSEAGQAYLPAVRAAFDQLKAGAERAGRLVQQLLTLAHNEPGAGARPMTSVDLTQLARDAVAEYAPIAEAKGVDLGLSASAAAGVTGDADALTLAATELMRKARELIRIQAHEFEQLGDTGAAHALLMLVDALETAKAGDKIMVVAFGQGVDVLVFEVTAENAKLPKRKGVSGWLARRKEEKNYMKFLAFNEMLPIDKGMRAEFDKKTALSVLWRKRDMIYGLVGGKCKVCGTVQFPRSQVCVNPNCHAIDSQEPYRMAGLEASVMSFTADSLTYSPDPPAYYGMITFPEGGRFMADFTDSDKEQVKVGGKMRMTFRIRDNDIMRGGFKRYFWKAAPV